MNNINVSCNFFIKIQEIFFEKLKYKLKLKFVRVDVYDISFNVKSI